MFHKCFSYSFSLSHIMPKDHLNPEFVMRRRRKDKKSLYPTGKNEIKAFLGIFASVRAFLGHGTRSSFYSPWQPLLRRNKDVTIYLGISTTVFFMPPRTGKPPAWVLHSVSLQLSASCSPGKRAAPDGPALHHRSFHGT